MIEHIYHIHGIPPSPLIPFHQVFTLTVLKRLLRKKENPILTKDVQDDLDKCVKIDIET